MSAAAAAAAAAGVFKITCRQGTLSGFEARRFDNDTDQTEGWEADRKVITHELLKSKYTLNVVFANTPIIAYQNTCRCYYLYYCNVPLKPN